MSSKEHIISIDEKKKEKTLTNCFPPCALRSNAEATTCLAAGGVVERTRFAPFVANSYCENIHKSNKITTVRETNFLSVSSYIFTTLKCMNYLGLGNLF